MLSASTERPSPPLRANHPTLSRAYDETGTMRHRSNTTLHYLVMEVCGRGRLQELSPERDR